MSDETSVADEVQQEEAEQQAQAELDNEEGVRVGSEEPELMEDQNEDDSSQDETASDSEQEGEDSPIPAEYHEQVGKIAAAERKRAEQKTKEHYEAKLRELQQQQQQLGSQPYSPGWQNGQSPVGSTQSQFVQQDGMIFDPETQNWFYQDSPEGRWLIRESLKEQKRQQEAQLQKQQEQQQNLQARISEFQDKVMTGHYVYKDYESAYNKVANQATSTIEEALLDVDKPAAMINYLGKNPDELSKIVRLTPVQQRKAIYKLEDRLQPKRKMTTQADKAHDGVRPGNASTKQANADAGVRDLVKEFREKFR